jgi:UDP-N-acetylmuramoyl-L-alanyl-D-glutamate--2,6-diaminopimelate ligase
VAFGQLCHALAGDPSHSLQAVGITGTYGKTSTERLLSGILSAAGQSHAALGADQVEQGGAMHVARWLAETRASGCHCAVLEASSRALASRQFSGLSLDAAVITNVRREHGSCHGSLRNYQVAKLRLLDQLKPAGFVVLNADDAVSRPLIKQLDWPTVTIGIQQPAELTATLLERHASEQTFLLDAGDESIVIRTHVIGDGHIYNCLSAAAVALRLGVEATHIVRGLEQVTALPNRLQRVECGQPFGVFIDASHTPHSLANALQTLRPVCSGNLHCLLGIDHNLPDTARAQLGRNLERYADSWLLTATRFDRRMSLRTAHEVLDGFDRPAQAHLMPDRAQAICWALAQAKAGDLVLLAGGAESMGPEEVPLCDEDVTRYWLQHVPQPKHCPWVPA